MAALLTGAAIPGPAAADISVSDSLAITRAESLARSGRLDAALSILDSLRSSATRHRNPSLEARALNGRAALLFLAGRARDAEAAARSALAAAAPNDTARRMASLRWLAASVGEQDRADEMRDLWSHLLSMALARRDQRHEGFARLGLAYYSLRWERGSEAVAGHVRALEIFRALKDDFWTRWTLNGLGSSRAQVGDWSGARECYAELATLAVAARDSGALGDAWNNMATLEWMVGDPAAASEGFRRAFEVRRSQARRRDALIIATNLALCDMDLGRFREGASLLQSVIEECDERGYGDVRGSALERLAGIRRKEGRKGESIALCRQALANQEALTLKTRIELSTSLAMALSDVGRLDEASEVLRECRKGIAADAGPSLTPELDYVEGGLRAMGETPAAGMGLLRSAAAGAGRLGKWRTRVDALTWIGLTHARLGEPDSAIAVLEDATEAWGQARGGMSDPEWRERQGAQTRLLYATLLPLRLDWPEDRSVEHRIAAAFDDLQRYKSRTLRERMRGPAATAASLDGTTLNRVQRDVLRPGELLLETFASPETTLVFAVTNSSVRVARLPGTRLGLSGQLRAWHRLISAPPARKAGDRNATLDSTAARLGLLVLAPFDDLLRASNRVLFAPDGDLNLLPLGTLDPGWGEGPLLASREVVVIPSAGVLAALRVPAGATPDVPRAHAMLALAAASDERGTPMKGAVAEARWLTQAFQDVETLSPGTNAPDSTLERALADCEILHVATHARLDDQRPWLSGLLVDPAAVDDRTRWLRAAEVARLRLPARLAVLSACESGRGQALSGEGVQGLTAAFLSAGVPAVVASLWKVEDRATERLMRGFYQRLGSGQTAAAALRGAQLELRRDRRTAQPFYWAGFVLVGEPSVRVTLKRRSGGGSSVAVGTAVAMVMGLALLGYRRRRARAGM